MADPWMTPEQVVAYKPGKQTPIEVEEPPVNEFDRVVIGNSIRLDIPITDLRHLPKIADMLRGLASDLDFAAHHPHLPDVKHRDYSIIRRNIMHDLAFKARLMRNHIRAMHKGRLNKNGTIAKY